MLRSYSSCRRSRAAVFSSLLTPQVARLDLQVARPLHHLLERLVLRFNLSKFDLPLCQSRQSLVERAILLELGFLTGLAARTEPARPFLLHATEEPVVLWSLQYAEHGSEAGLHVGVELLRIGEAELRLGQPEQLMQAKSRIAAARQLASALVGLGRISRLQLPVAGDCAALEFTFLAVKLFGDSPRNPPARERSRSHAVSRSSSWGTPARGPWTSICCPSCKRRGPREYYFFRCRLGHAAR